MTFCHRRHLSHGKTLLMDLLVQQTHAKAWKLDKEYRYTDTLIDEQVGREIHWRLDCGNCHAVITDGRFMIMRRNAA